MKKYTVIFEDVFTFAKDTRTVSLTEQHYQYAIRQMQNRTIVVNTPHRDKYGQIVNHTTLIIHSIKEQVCT